MTARNDITGDLIASKTSSDAYREGHERIFGKKTEKTSEQKTDETKSDTESEKTE